MKPKTIAALLAAALFVTILLLNTDDVPFNLIFRIFYIPKLVLILSSLFLGWLFGWFTHLAYYKGRFKNVKTDKLVDKPAAPQSSDQTESPEKDKSEEESSMQT